MNKFRSLINLLFLTLLGAGFCLSTGNAQTTGWQWRELTPASGPAPDARRTGVAIYDPQGKRLVIFGGTGNSGFYNDTWAFDLATRFWTKLATTGATPAPRHGFDAIYDPVAHRMVIYAGQGAGFFSDTWALNLTTLEWRDISPPVAARPRARYGQASIFDPVTRSLVQFAGFTEESRRFQDTQSFSLATNTWQDLTPGGAKPDIRCLLTAAYDRQNRRMVIYGGQRSGFLDDIWSFDLASRTWQNLTPTQRPAGRWFANSFVDRDGRFNVFGGFSSAGNVNELQSFDFQTRQWSLLRAANPPSRRNGALGAYIEADDRLLIFGGQGDNGFLNDVWELRRPAAPTALATVSAASYDATAIAPESIVAAFGVNLATGSQSATTQPLPATLAGTSVRVHDSLGAERNAPLFFVSPTQVNYLIPQGTASGAATVTLTSGDGATATGTLNVGNIAPSLFTVAASGQGFPAGFTQRTRAGATLYESLAVWDAAQNRFAAVPIDLSVANEPVFLALFGTGFRHRSGLSGVTLRIGGVDTQVLFAGAQGEFAGLDQMNLQLPQSLAGRGEVEAQLIVDGRTANTVRINFR
ncbi:MAG: kelch repeat-containing protein [Blastocatellia bacterium]